MVSRKLRKENLTDSLKLNRERLASTPRGGNEQRGASSTRSFKSFDANLRESKFADADDENQSSRLNERPRIAFAEKPAKVVRATENGIKDELLSFLDEAAESAAGERDATISRLGYKDGKRYDWEAEDDDYDDLEDCSSGEAPDKRHSDHNSVTPLSMHPISNHMKSYPSLGSASSSRSRTQSGRSGPSAGLSTHSEQKQVDMTQGPLSSVRRVPCHLEDDCETRSHFAVDSPAISSVASSSRMTTSTSQRSSRYTSLKLELEDKRKTIDALKRALESSRREKSEAMHKASNDSQQMMEEQRKEHEQAVARHLGFIDKLLADKKQLAAKVEELASRIKRGEEDMARKVREMDDQHSREMTRVKETMAAADAAKRQRWQKEKTRELKELTIKGLEPEVQSILAKHKDDLRIIEDKFKDEVRAIRDAQEREKERALAELRSRHEADLEEVRSSERTSMLAKLRQMEERHQEDLKAQRARLEGEFEDLRKRHRNELQETQASLRERIADSARQRESELEVEKQRLETQLEGLEQKWAIEKEQWQARVVRKLEEKAAADEKKIREKLTAQRDKQIDAIISKLYAEQESKSAEKKVEQQNSIRQAETRAKTQIQEAKQEAQDWRTKYEHLRDARQAEKQTFSSAESRVRDLEHQAEQRERRIVELNGKVASINDLLAEREQKVRSEYADRNSNYIRRQAELQATIESLQENLSHEVAARKQSETEMRSAFEEETAEIHRRVRATLSRKDETIRALRAQIEEMEGRFASYDELLEKQRQDFVSGGGN